MFRISGLNILKWSREGSNSLNWEQSVVGSTVPNEFFCNSFFTWNQISTLNVDFGEFLALKNYTNSQELTFWTSEIVKMAIFDALKDLTAEFDFT